MARENLRPGLRMSPVRGHLIFCLPTDGGIEVVRVLHGSRDIDAAY